MADPLSSAIHGLAATLEPDGLTVRVSPGYCYTQDMRRLQFDGSMSAVLSAPAANTFYSLYALPDASGLGALEIEPGHPDSPYLGFARSKPGDPSRRYICSGRTEASARFRSGAHILTGDAGNFIKLDRGSAAVPTPARVLTLSILTLVPPTLQTINLSGLLPPTATMVRLKVANSSNLTAYFSRAALGAPTTTQHTDYVPGASVLGTPTTDTVELILDSTLTVTMLPLATGVLGNVVTIGAGTVAVEVQGYYFNR